MLLKEDLSLKIKILVACAIFLAASYCGAQSTSAPSKPSNRASAPTKAASAGRIDPQKEADIRRLAQLTGAGKLGLQAMSNMEANLKPLLERSLPPGEYRAKLIGLFFQKFHAQATQEALVAMIIPIYDRHFSDQEIKALIAFYESPIGKKTTEVMPQVMVESQEAGGRWGQELGSKCMQEVLTEHPELKKQMEDAKQSSSY